MKHNNIKFALRNIAVNALILASLFVYWRLKDAFDWLERVRRFLYGKA